MSITERGVLALTLLLVPACAQVLGIEDAVEDPTLEGSSGGAAGQGGSGQSGNAQGSKASGGQGSQSAGGTGANANGGSAGKDDDAGSAGAGGVSVCEEYCTDMEAYCEADYPQYKDREQCLKVCGVLPPGALGDADGDSAACRLKYAGKARYAAGTELAAYCRQAGPGGDGRCGSNCEGYCSVMMVACTEASSPLYHYKDMTECLDVCSGLPPSDVSYDVRDPLVFDGNHVQCRLFHATSGLMADADEHCEHAMGVTLCEADQ
ncbi:MAG: hypothetical protein H6718_17850 [Polyangiaceae bacterium]|nr:hypothetical protein [Polyangiaceae bacterium]